MAWVVFVLIKRTQGGWSLDSVVGTFATDVAASDYAASIANPTTAGQVHPLVAPPA